VVLSPGMRLGPYEILTPLGAGGMGEVYKARDTRLGRTVAVKILPAEAATDDRRRRFELEARAVSTLNHPHICALFDVGSQDGIQYLVMELLEGQTLAERLQKGPLPIELALELAGQVAEALNAAHHAGIVHRDLKPSNVMLVKPAGHTTAIAKLLDFGLARLGEPFEGESSVLTQTAAGAVAGTWPYMAPEQVEGRPVDPRTDIFAFGSLLYETLTGRRAFEGSSPASTAAAILEHEPTPITVLQPTVPPALGRLVTRCLAKDPDARWQTARDLADEVGWIESEMRGSAGGAPANAAVSRGWSRPRKTAAAAALVAACIGGAWLAATLGGRHVRLPWRETPAGQPGTSVGSISPTAGVPGLGPPEDIAISPDGKTLVFRASDGHQSKLYALRRDQETAARPLEGTENAHGACFSPDGNSIAFMSPIGLYHMKLDGEPPIRIAPDNFHLNHGLEWEPDGTIVFSRGSRSPGLWTVPAGGEMRLLLKPEAPAVEYVWPRALPGTDVLTFTRQEGGRLSIAAWRPGLAQPQIIVLNGSHGRYLPKTGHLVYQANGQLLAVRFDPHALKLLGEASVVARDVGNTFPVIGEFDVSADGTLVYLPPTVSGLAWKPRDGAVRPLAVRLNGSIDYVALSPDGLRASVGLSNQGMQQVWLANRLDGQTLTGRFTDGDADWFGLFSPDGKRFLFTSAGTDNRNNIYSSLVDKGGAPSRQTNSPHNQQASSFCGPNVFLYHEVTGENADVWEQELDRPSSKRKLLASPAREMEAGCSADRKWLVFEKDVNKLSEVFVQRYPDGRPTAVSPEQGAPARPRWSPVRGDEVFFQNSTDVFAVRVVDGVPAGAPTRLFSRPDDRDRNWDTADGVRFLVAEHFHPARIEVVTDFFETLKAKVK
jgi:eukaryotic-like serine/threonine-protein kinase